MSERSKRQFLRSNVRIGFGSIKRKWKPHAAKVKIQAAHAAKVGYTDWRTRTIGSPAQIGAHFPVGPGSSKKLPRFRYGKPSAKADTATPCEARAFAAEQDLIAHGFKGFEIEIKLKSGRYVSIPLIAKDWHEAFSIAHKQMQKYNPEDIDEITIVDPSLSEIAHAISGGAHRLAAGIKRGIEKIPAYARKAKAYGMKGARALGRIAATPGEMKDVYELEKARRGEAAAEVPAPAQTEEQILAEAKRLQRIGVAGAEPAAAARPPAPTPGIFAGYTAEEWKSLRERREVARKAKEAPMTPSERERRRRVASRPFQSRSPLASRGEYVSIPSEEEPSTALKKAKRAIRRAQRAIRRLG